MTKCPNDQMTNAGAIESPVGHGGIGHLVILQPVVKNGRS